MRTTTGIFGILVSWQDWEVFQDGSFWIELKIDTWYGLGEHEMGQKLQNGKVMESTKM